MTIKECIICNKKFAPVVGNQIKCPLCRDKKRSVAKLRTIECIVCHKPFSTKTYNKKFCSKKCREAFHYTPIPADHICLCCGTAFISPKGNRKYCSDFCSLQAKMGRLKYKEVKIGQSATN